MTKEAFLQLAGQLYDAQSGAKGDGRPPKFDTRLPAGSGQIIWASECSLKELQYQKGRSDKPPSDPKYAESNAKRSKALQYWIDYRMSNPTEQWRGERDRTSVTGAVPSDKPDKYDREAPPVSHDPVPSDESDIPF